MEISFNQSFTATLDDEASNDHYTVEKIQINKGTATISGTLNVPYEEVEMYIKGSSDVEIHGFSTKMIFCLETNFKNVLQAIVDQGEYIELDNDFTFDIAEFEILDWKPIKSYGSTIHDVELEWQDTVLDFIRNSRMYLKLE